MSLKRVPAALPLARLLHIEMAMNSPLKSTFLSLFALSFLVACEASKDESLDKDAVFDQKPVRDNLWTSSGNRSNLFDGLSLSTAPASLRNGDASLEVNLESSNITKKLSALRGLTTGTARIEFFIPKAPTDKTKVPVVNFEVSFSTGVGLPAELRITQNELSAKCGALDNYDGLATKSAKVKLLSEIDYELRIVLDHNAITVYLGKEAVIPSFVCEGVQDSNTLPRSEGVLSISLLSQNLDAANTQKLNRSAPLLGETQALESQLLLKRVTVYREARLPSGI